MVNNGSEHTDLKLEQESAALVELYKQFLPLILITCLLALVINSAILTAILCSKHLLTFKSSRGYLPTVTSLVCADTLTSLMLGIQLFCGSYLPVVLNIEPSPCLMLPLECIRLGCVVTTVLHLLVLSILHTATVAVPLGLSKVFTARVLGMILAVLWVLPTTSFTLIFTLLPGQLLSSESCSDYSLLQTFFFRCAFTSVIFVPIAIISMNYAYFYYLLSKRYQIQSPSGVASSQRLNPINLHSERVNAGVAKQNKRAATVTLLVLLSCSVCWIPVSVAHLLICPVGCYLSPADIPPRVGFFLHAISNLLLVAKSLINPLIFALRQRQIRSALSRLIRCLDPEAEERRHRQRSVTRYSYISRNTRNRINLT